MKDKKETHGRMDETAHGAATRHFWPGHGVRGRAFSGSVFKIERTPSAALRAHALVAEKRREAGGGG